jgi:3-methyladenine DNA glycosylase AlkC
MPESRKFMSQKPEPLKNLLSADFVSQLSKAFKKADPNFDAAKFQKSCIDKSWNEKELKQRIRHISKTIHDFLPYHYKKQIGILLKVAPNFGGLASLVFPDFVEVYGLADIDVSLDALEILTQLSTAEFAIRPLISAQQKKVMQQVKKWAKHPNEHVRRLASEGIRPRLPWAAPLSQFKKNPAEVLQVLEILKNDPSEYVRRSVANNLNDIAKDHPDLLLKTAKNWIGKSEETDKLLKHACRTLLKQGNVTALGLFGFSKNFNASIQKFKIQNPKISIGDTLSFSFELTNDSKKTQQLRIEYIVHFLKNNGKHSQKVFQLSSKHFLPGTTAFKRTHRFKDFTTRKHYPGKHFIVIAVNGVEKVKADVMVSR